MANAMQWPSYEASQNPIGNALANIAQLRQQDQANAFRTAELQHQNALLGRQIGADQRKMAQDAGLAFARAASRVPREQRQQLFEQAFASDPDWVAAVGPQFIAQARANPHVFDDFYINASLHKAGELSDQEKIAQEAALSQAKDNGTLITDASNRPTFVYRNGTSRVVPGVQVRQPPVQPAAVTVVPGFTDESGAPVVLDPRANRVVPAGVGRGAAGAPPKLVPSKPQGNLTEQQANALLFGSRMQAAEQNLRALEDAGKGALPWGYREASDQPLLGPAVTAAAAPETQQLDQAQRDFINATLRRESGAAISSSEFANAYKQYFPQPGDSGAVIEQKRRNRELAIRGILAAVPEAQRNSLSSDSAPPRPSKPAAQPKAQGGGWSATRVK